jgi:hypothetical protein
MVAWASSGRSADCAIVATYTPQVSSEDPERIDQVLERIDSVRELAGSALLFVIGIASVLTGGLAGWLLGVVFIAWSLAFVIPFARRFFRGSISSE